jgi:hypothetical protein
MKKLLAVLTLASTLIGARAQSNDLNTVWSFLADAGTNLFVVPYATLWQSDHGTKFGGGAALGYHLSDYLVPTLRIDVLDGVITMPSGSAQIQYQIKLSQNLSITPFAVGGIATPIMGRGTQNGSAVGIMGAGAAIKYKDLIEGAVDYEKWTGYSGNQIRIGLVFHKLPKWLGGS